MAGSPTNSINVDTIGSVFFDSSSSPPAFVSITPGPSATVLTSTGTGTVPTWQSASGSVTIAGDTGSISGSSLTIKSGVSTNNSGATVEFVNSATTSTLNVSDSGTFNTFIGRNSGDISITGRNNTALGCGSLFELGATCASNTAVGEASLQQTTGSNNTAIGTGSLTQAISGNYNLAAGQSAGANYASSESSNICLNSNGVVSESNTLHIGNGTGTGDQELNKAFICGINGNTVSNTMMVTIDSSTDQLGTMSLPVFQLVSSQTASTSASIIFTNLNSYKFYFLLINDCGPDTTNQMLEILVSQDNGSTYLGSSYACGINYAPYNSATLTNVNSTSYIPLTSSMLNTNTYSGNFYIFNTNIGSPLNIEGSGTWTDSSLGTVTGNYIGLGPTGVNAIKIQYSSGNISEGSFNLYGLSS